jgi:hypothetical protein
LEEASINLTKDGKLYAADIIPILRKKPMQQYLPEATNFDMTFDKLHSCMGQPNDEVLIEAAKVHNIQLSEVHHRPCQHCCKAKIRLQNIPKRYQ